MKLPKLELPKFDGDVLKFQNFGELFEAAVHDNDNVPYVQKFTYLRSALEGVAYHTIEGFEVTSANYHHTVDALKHRFGRKRIIISSLVKSIVQLEPRSNEGVASLRDLHDTQKPNKSFTSFGGKANDTFLYPPPNNGDQAST